MIVTSEALAAGRISVQWKPDGTKRFKSGFKNSHQRITDENCLWQRVQDRRCWKPESTPREVCSLTNRWSSSGVADERKIRLQARSANRRCRSTGVDVLRTLYVRTANLYVIRCWTDNQCSWCSNGLAWDRFDEPQSELQCSVYSVKGVASLNQVGTEEAHFWSGEHERLEGPRARVGSWEGVASPLPASYLGSAIKLPQPSWSVFLHAFCAARLPLLAPQYVLYNTVCMGIDIRGVGTDLQTIS